MEATTRPTLLAGKGTMAFVRDAAWWRAAFDCCVRFAPRCFVAAGVMTVANIALLLSYNLISGQVETLTKMQQPMVISNDDLGLMQSLGSLLGSLLGSMAGLIALVVALCMWMNRLHIFGRAVVKHGLDAGSAEFDEAAAFVKANRKFLVVFWLVASAYLLLPSLALTGFIGAKLMLRPEIASLLELPESLNLEALNFICDALGTTFLIVILANTFVGLVGGALANTDPARLASSLLRDVIKNPLAPFALTVLVCILNALVALPFTAAVLLFPNAQLESNNVYIVVSQLWLGATSTIVWPLSLAPFCKITTHAESN